MISPEELALDRVLMLDGAMGSLIQSHKLEEADFRGSRFAAHPVNLKDCNDILCLTKPDFITGIHEAYLRAGADIIETCSFNATAVSLADYGIGELAYELSFAAARLARQSADRFSRPEQPRLVAGSMGPTAKSASIPGNLSDLGSRAIGWDELEAAYYDHARGLWDGGVDMLLIETIYDTLNAKAAVSAVERLREERRQEMPLMLSATLTEGGRLLSGQTVAAFCVSIAHGKPWSLGLNCSFGADRLRSLAAAVPYLVSVYPNAGLPDRFGVYGETPELMASATEAYLREGLVNILGGCCGSTPDHIAAIAAAAQKYPARPLPPPKNQTILAGLNALPLEKAELSWGKYDGRALDKALRAACYDDAVELLREQAEDGGMLIPINTDHAPDPQAAMTRLLNLALVYQDIADAPCMLDSSRWEVIEAGLKCVQGKVLVKADHLGEAGFEGKAPLLRRYGAAAALTVPPGSRKEDMPAYSLLREAGFPPEDILTMSVCP